MKTGKEYIDSLRELKTKIYYMGKRLDNIVGKPGKHPTTS